MDYPKKSMSAKPIEIDDPAKFVQILSAKTPANPLALATIISARGVSPTESSISAVLGQPTKQLLANANSFLYSNTISYALNTAPHQIATTLPTATRAAGAVKDARSILSALNAGGITCEEWGRNSDAYRRNTLINWSLATAKNAVEVAAAVTALCPQQPVVGTRVGQAYLQRAVGGNCNFWRGFTQAAKLSNVQLGIIEPDRVAGRSQTLTAEQIIAEIDRECMVWHTDWPSFLRYLPAPRDNPSHNPRTCDGFLSMTDRQKRDAFIYSGWSASEVDDGMRRFSEWCQQNNSLRQAMATVYRSDQWRLRSQLIRSVRDRMQSIVFQSVHAAVSNVLPEFISMWEQNLYASGEIISLPVLCQYTYDACRNSGNMPYEPRTVGQILSSGNRGSNVVKPWLVTGTGVLPNGGFDALDPVQGCVGDCYLISAMSSIVFSKPGLLETIVRRIGPGQNGATRYSVRIKGEQIDVDDTFQVSPFFFIGMYAQGIRQDAQWPGLIEKAYAAWRTRNTSGYPNMPTVGADYFGGDLREDARRSVASGIAHVEFPAADLVGGETFWWLTYFRSGDECWNRLNSHCDARSGRAVTPMSGSTYSTDIGPDDTIDRGIVPAHAYSIFGVSASPKAIIMRNPWGYGTPDESLMVPIPGGWNHINVSGEYNGVFAMRPDAFARYFGCVYGTLI